ncbi:transposase [Methanosphaera sp. ISO3-F5]|uniref:transposase n=1 Tax=Methanosphaera sp. ISO3-F5 TaxID=1452353 RepID=UPI002B262109|nr:transposase [Methanosphaera sp. ISO3-F5]WQH64171.1 transposase [Methanosphaera sp. ISO3-F5]WQH64355.1 transposase [Methanosphaera sp. ISO3-F5]
MKFMIKIVIKNLTNKKLINKLTNILNKKELELENILSTVNKPSNYKILLKTLKNLSPLNNTINKLYEYVKKNKCSIKTKSKIKLENIQKTMLLSYFYNKNLQHKLIMEKPMAIILDNYKVHHAIVFTKLCDILNIDLIYLPPYSPKYNPIEQVWRKIKAVISRKYIDNKENLINEFETEYYESVDKPSFWKKWVKEILLDI